MFRGHPGTRGDVKRNEPFLWGWFYLPPHKTPPALDAAEPREEANDCYRRCGQTGSPAPCLTGRPSSAPGSAAYPTRSQVRLFDWKRSLTEGKPGFGALTVKARVCPGKLLSTVVTNLFI